MAVKMACARGEGAAINNTVIKSLLRKVSRLFLLQVACQGVLKNIPFMRAWGSRGSNFSAPTKRHTSGNRAVQLPAPGRPTALLSVYLLSYELQCAGLRCAQAVAPRIKITPPFAPHKRSILLPRTRCSRNKHIDVFVSYHYEKAVLYRRCLGRKVLPPPPLLSCNK